MNHSNPFLARVLKQGARALAAYAASELLESQPDARAGFEADPLIAWQNWLVERLEELAAAVATEQSAILTRQVEWATAFLVARGFALKHIRSSLEHLRGVLERELPETVGPLAVDYLDHALRSFDEPNTDLSVRLRPDTSHGRLAAQYLLALFQGDRQRATRPIFDALENGDSVRELLVNVLLPAQSEVGRMWHADEINVAEEHLISATTKSVMAQLMSHAEFRPNNGRTMLAAGVAGNHVDIGLQAVADFFELEGWRAIQLGADVPTYDIVQAVEYFEADLVGLSASQTTQLETVRQTIKAIRSTERGDAMKIIVGGFAFAGSEHLASQLGADGYAPDPAAAVELGRRLVFGKTHQEDDEFSTDAGAPVASSQPYATPQDGHDSRQPDPTFEAVSDTLPSVPENPSLGHAG
jgi:5-methyltetrahydrofolate--homocysteine methyltransferase